MNNTQILAMSMVLLMLFVSGCCRITNSVREPGSSSNFVQLAHRGHTVGISESTIATFEMALKRGVDGLEFDLHQTLDGVPVVSHDSRVLAGINKGEGIATLTIEQLRGENPGKTALFPTLSEVVQLAKRFNATPIWLEIKDSSRYPAIIENVHRILSNEEYEAHAIIQSFDTRDLAALHIAGSSAKLLKLYFYRVAYNFDELPKYIDYVGLPLGVGYIHPDIIAKIHNNGYGAIFWREASVFEKPCIIEYLSDYNADGVMIDTAPILIDKRDNEY